MRTVELASPRFTDRIAEAEQVAADPDLSPELADADRVLLSGRLRSLRRAIDDRGAVEQLLHGEPHPGNVLSTSSGPLFIDFETSCRGPVEFDLAHVPEAVCEHYPSVEPRAPGRVPAARPRDGRRVALEAWRRVSEPEAMGTGVPALAARGSSVANTRHDDQAARGSVGAQQAARLRARCAREIDGVRRRRRFASPSAAEPECCHRGLGSRRTSPRRLRPAHRRRRPGRSAPGGLPRCR